MFGRKEAPPNPRKPQCSLCGDLRDIVPVMRRAGEGDQKEDDPDWAILVCPVCDQPHT